MLRCNRASTGVLTPDNDIFAADEKEKQKRKRSTRRIPHEGGLTREEAQNLIIPAAELVEQPIIQPLAPAAPDPRPRCQAHHHADTNPKSVTEQCLFSYTSSRFLYNESIRLRERYVEFDVAALKEAKLSEGVFNRVFLVKLEDNSQVIVKIPFDHSVPRTYATASEVATITFLRSKGIPAPMIYGWSCTADNPVGVEYIVMELALGIGLNSNWFELTKKQQLTVATEAIDIEKKLFAIPFSATGSIYFKRDISPALNPHEYLPAIGKRELAWAKEFGKPQGVDFPHNAFFPEVNSHELYISLLEKYLAIAPFLLPRQHSDPRSQAVLRHPDLTPNAEVPNTLDPPEPPEEYDTFDPTEKAEIDELLRRRHLYYLYRVFNGARNKQHLSVCADPVLRPRHLVDCAGRQWLGNLMNLRGALIRMHHECPISFTEKEVQKHEEDESMWFKLNLLVNNWRGQMGGLSEERWMRAEAYDQAVKNNKELKAQCIREADPDEVDSINIGWPFRDREEFF
ncbi:hypothetical protein ACJ73_08451 [Blastomyces percursus]|uniref:Aminoglycoside phosphotransferase domain-containing protein n=1 Tax=Blastomyces percursus TaxID=1658174 RepID=A0A1J9PV08_9EURO|nr:hypothetical protein ACJ73_08451 [Blastomyces percursus]